MRWIYFKGEIWEKKKEKGFQRIEKKKINIRITHSRIENADARKKNKISKPTKCGKIK